MARNPFGHAIHEDARDELAALVGEKGAEKIFENMEARLPVEESAPMEKGLRFEVINYQPGDFGGMGKAWGEYAVYVSGDTFPIKDRLKKLGLRWDPKRNQWGLWHRYTDWKTERGSVSREQVEKAIDKVQSFVKDYNAEVETSNQAKLSAGGIADDPRPTTTKGMVKQIMSAERLNKRLKKNGLAIVYDWPTGVGGFNKSGAYNTWVVGKTWLVKNALKRFGFSFERVVPVNVKDKAKKAGLKDVQAGWMMDGATYDRISRQVDQHLLRAAEGTLKEAEELDQNLDEQGFVIGAGGLEEPSGKGMKLQPNTAYYYGASSSPSLIIVDSVKGGRITYHDPYSKKRRTEQEWIFRDLAEKGTRSWLKVYARYQPELAKNMKALLDGKSAKANGADFDRFKVIVTAVNPKGDMWRAAEEFGSVGGFADDPNRYEITLNRASLNQLRKDRRFSVESESAL